MNRCIYLGAVALTVSACSGGGEATLEFPGTNLSGTTYQGRGVTAQSSSLSTAVTLDETGATLRFTPSASGGSGASAYQSVTLSLDGEDFLMFPDTGATASSLLDDDAIVFAPTLANVGELNDVLFVTFISGSGFFISDVGFYVLGNQTPVSALPNGAVTYTGRAVMIDGASPLDTASGSFSATVDFGSGALSSGTIGMDTGSLSGVGMTLAPAALTGSEFVTTLASTDVTIDNSYLEGRLFGGAAGELAGTMHVSTPTNDYVGMFGAVD